MQMKHEQPEESQMQYDENIPAHLRVEESVGSDEDDDDSMDDESITSTDEYEPPAASSSFSNLIDPSLTKDVKMWRTGVTIMLLSTAALVICVTYFLFTGAQVVAFNYAFRQYANTVAVATSVNARNTLDSLSTAADSITSYSKISGSEWPKVTVPDFEVLGEHARQGSRAVLLEYSPVLRTDEEKLLWQNYSLINAPIWLTESYDYLDFPPQDRLQGTFTDYVFKITDGNIVPETSTEPWLPMWQLSPPPIDESMLNFNVWSSANTNLNSEDLEDYFMYTIHRKGIIIDRILSLPILAALFDQIVDEKVIKEDINAKRRKELLAAQNSTDQYPYSSITVPVYESFAEDAVVRGFLNAIIRWDSFFERVLPSDVREVDVVLHDKCSRRVQSYAVIGVYAYFSGYGDHHDSRYTDMAETFNITSFVGLSRNEITGQLEECTIEFTVYPSHRLYELYVNKLGLYFTLGLIGVFSVTGLVFGVYVRHVHRRQRKVMATAARTNAIVTSLFPSNVRDRIMKDAENQAAMENGPSSGNGALFLPGFGEAPKMKLKTFLDTENKGDGDDEKSLVMFKTKPIADLFPEATVLFADIVGFTAWSSVREPTQVFQLLETIYHSFDEIARRRRVFKVETIGDCYVAVAGLPDPRKDHAVVMARFARDCMITMQDLTRKLEVTLGPDTGDLSMRMGLHSGPVTAGVLRGEKSRFQLFGDTVNTAARMESTGGRGRIQVSLETADCLVAGGKSNWIRAREEKVRAKGKGELQTFWLEARSDGTASVTSGSTNSYSDHNLDEMMPQPAAPVVENVNRTLDPKSKRLVDWNCDQMVRLLKLIVARRNAHKRRSHGSAKGLTKNLTKPAGTVLDEVKEIISLPKFDAKVYRHYDDPDSVVLDDDVVKQLHDYVSTIACLYNDNPFHNFEHASHVTMSVSKLLSRIVSPQDVNRTQDYDGNDEKKIEQMAWEIHMSTYGITSDPLTQFAVVFSALIHDCDHSGVPNVQLVKENVKIAQLYKQRSVAEQNSVDLAWDLLMDVRYESLRSIIYTNASELERFRQLVVNTVMATDIVDKELKALRNARWDKAFSGKNVEDNEGDDVNRKATIVIEHLIQASDVAHTMQHWHIFRKWNERLFREMYKAYKQGRAEKDPSGFWYEGELGFFDFYIIPLAKKLKECGVFGVSSEEYLNYALKNRDEWKVKGNEIVEDMKQRTASQMAEIVPPNGSPAAMAGGSHQRVTKRRSLGAGS